MLKSGTVFVLGAAVSNEIGFPLGSDLKEHITRTLGEHSMTDTVRYALHTKGGQQIWAARDQLIGSLDSFNSIDNLVEFFTGNKLIESTAKIAIAAAILAAETETRMAHGRQDTQPVKTNSVYGDLFKLIIQGATPATISEALSRVTFITFNYDRSIEQFFLRMIVRGTSLDWRGAYKALESLNVLHCYGSLGDIAEAANRPFGIPAPPDTLIQMAGDLRTFSEGARSEEGQAIKDAIAAADRLIFLGCAHHPQNMRLLQPEEAFRARPVYATLYSPPPPDPGDWSKPTIDVFTGPARDAFAHTFTEWSIDSGRVPHMMRDSCRVHAYTSRQLVALYQSEWIDVAKS